MKHLAIYILLLVTIISIGCGTDVKPNYFIGMFRDEGDIDRLSNCLSAIPEIDAEGNIVIKADSQCLTDLSKRDTSDPNVDVSFTEILNDPEAYMDKLLTFEAVIKKLHYNRNPELYTNRKLMEFHITSHDAPIKVTNEEGEEVDIIPNQKYRFTVRIYEIKIYPTGLWRIQAEFIVTVDKKIVYPPENVQDE